MKGRLYTQGLMAIPEGCFGDYLLKKEESLKMRGRKRRVYKAKIADSTSNWGKPMDTSLEPSRRLSVTHTSIFRLKRKKNYMSVLFWSACICGRIAWDKAGKSFYQSYLIFVRCAITLSWNFPRRPGWPTGEPRGYSCFHLPNFGVTGVCHYFVCVLEI